MTVTEHRCRRVGHSIIKAGGDLEQLAQRLEGASWDMVELDVLARGDELVVAHSPEELDHPRPVVFADAVRTLRDLLPERVELDVDLKSTGYERAVVDTLRSLDLIDRTLVSTMEESSLRVLRGLAPELRLGLSIPKARRDYLSHRLTRPAAYAMLAYLRRVMPRRAAEALRSGLADAIMAHWGIVTPRLVAAVRAAGGELYVWTVDDAQRLLSLHALGVNAVITNDRELFARAGLQPS
ncbi:MAG TPA: glycerophosphodiester phosphodiesterase [Solirubrobacteraceae bacterium]|jgi:glycerophosphoryl diester phosphodiesterase